MVFGRLIRSFGLSKPQATPEEHQSDITSVFSAEDSITKNARETSQSSRQSQDEASIATDIGDEEMSEASEPSDKSSNFVQTGEVFSKMMLLQFRTVVDEQCAVAVARAMPSPSSTVKACNSRPEAMTPTAGSWVAAMQCKRSVVDPNAEDLQVNRKACSILNKLTVEKFDSLFEQLATCGIKKPEHLEMLMCEVFNKATTQHHFIAMYADLCVRLEQDSRISSVVEAAGRQHSFRRLILNQCQMSFEKLLQSDDADTDHKGIDTDEEFALKRKQKALGNIKLIGQLLVHGIVTSKLLVECSEEMLRCRDTCPEALESLCALLTVAGKQFDTETWQYHPRLLDVFSCMRKLSKDKSTQARVRFLLRDVLDVREAGWSHCTYKATLATAPMKLSEVAESANNEGKYMSLEDQIETDTLLAGLMNISQKANAKNERHKDQGAAYSETSPMQSKPGRHKSYKGELSPNKLDAKGKKGASQTKAKEGSPRAAFDVVAFRRALASVLADLSSDRNVPAAVRRIRLQAVPPEFQAKEFADIITRIVEERRGPIRRCALAFTAGLAAADEQSAFDRMACLEGIGQFFHEVYPELCNEIPRLPAIVTSELLPTLRNVYPSIELDRHLPVAFAAA